jgi:hypothetical protein
MEVIRQLAALKDVIFAVTATIATLEHGEEADVSAVLRRSAAARDDADRFMGAIVPRVRGEQKSCRAGRMGKNDSDDEGRLYVGGRPRVLRD